MRRMPWMRIWWLALLATPAAWGAVQDVRTLPARAAATSGQDLILPVTWQVTFDVGDSTGAFSAGGSFVNAATGVPLGLTVPTTLGERVGGGIQLHPETLTVDGATLAAWYDQGVRRVGYRRTFVSVADGSSRTGQLLLTLSGSALADLREPVPGQLRVLRMELAFESGRQVEIVPRQGALGARVTLAYSGSGTLRGRWQVADPGGAAPLFRTLSLVRKDLPPAQRATLESPTLPTGASGRYILRFCLDDASGVPLCEDVGAAAGTGVQTMYEVVERVVGEIVGLQPAGAAAAASTVFRWEPVAAATIYQLQVFAAQASGAPQFLTGQLLGADAATTVLSPLVMARLAPGTRYRWRVTAHDADGRLLARSELAEFVYQP